MLDMILSLLRESGADAWEVTDSQERGWEFYFIRHRLDQHRAKLVEHIWVKVYVRSEDGKFLGSASAEIAPTATRAEAEATIRELVGRAAYVKNPAYTLVKPDGGEQPAAEPVAVERIARDFLETMEQLPETETEDLNSYEIFVSEVRRRFLNSEGVDVTSVYPSSMVEAVVNARRDGHEIELYRLYKSGSCDREQLTRDLSETLRYGRDKLVAVPTPAIGKTAVVFSTDAAREIYEWFIARMSAGMRYRRISDWTEGKPIAPEFRGDRMTVEAVTKLPNSSANAAYDDEGARIRPRVLIREGIAEASFGSRQFSQYMGLEDSFQPGNFAVSGGTATAEELRQGRYLEVVEFSDFQVNPFNGDIAGEIRLGYWHDGDQVTIVSGGSVSGTMADFVQDLHCSREQRQYNSLLIPAVTRLEGVTVTGAE
ncbi:MAG: TldD/PmbA family protein [Clostridia bacterium]|nr:TldD/PmbA family protein [Clostridia bacterium]